MTKSFWLVSFLWIAATGLLAQKQFVYTNDNASPETTGASGNSVSAFRANPDGTLTLLPGSPFSTGGTGSNGGSIAAYDIAVVQPSHSEAHRPLLYAVNQGDGTMAAFFIDPQTGSLISVPGAPFLIDGPLGGGYSITPGRKGAFLFVAKDSATVIRVYSILSNGTLVQVPGSPFETGMSWRGLKVTSDGHFLIAGEASGNGVGVFSIARNGALSAVPGSPFLASAVSNGVTADCAGRHVFDIDSGQSVDVYDMSLNGRLTPVAGSPFSISTGFNSGGTLTPNGRFLFVTDPFGANFTGYISAFAVAHDGALSQVSGSPFLGPLGNPGVSATTTSADGKYLYSFTFESAQVDVQTIGTNGALTDIGSFFTANPALPGAGSGMGIAGFPPPSCGDR